MATYHRNFDWRLILGVSDSMQLTWDNVLDGSIDQQDDGVEIEAKRPSLRFQLNYPNEYRASLARE